MRALVALVATLALTACSAGGQQDGAAGGTVGFTTGDGTVTIVHVSWNGATEVRRWRVLGADGKRVAQRARSGFETAIPVAGGGTSFQVQALDKSGKVIGTSEKVTPGTEDEG